jgi:hypothetical protein
VGLLDEDHPEVLVNLASVSHRRNPIPLALAVVGLLSLAVTLWPTGGNPAVSPDLTTTTTAPNTTSSSTPASPAASDNPVPFAFPEISLVSSSATGDRAVAVPFSTSGEVRQLGMISEFELDSSGTFMAALLGSDREVSPQALIVGQVGGDFDRIVTDNASGFAWHDFEPGTLGYIEASTPDRTSLQVLDVSDIENSPIGLLAADGWLRHFGSWGFATTQSQMSPGFQMFNPSGAAIYSTEVGAAVGYVSTIGMIATLSEGDHVGIDPATGDFAALPMLAGQDVLWRVRTGGPRGTFAVQVTGLEFTDHKVLVFNRINEVVARFRSAPLPQAMEWDRAGTKLVFAVDDSTDRTTLIVFDAETGTTIESSFLEDPSYPRTIGLISY